MCSLQELEGLGSGVGQGEGRALDVGQQARAGVHVEDELVHLGQLLGGGVDDQVGALLDDGQVVVGDQGGDFDDGVARRIEPRHLQIDPGQHAGGMLPVPVPSPGAWRRTGYCPSMLRVPLHRLDEDLPVPAYARAGDAGADLLARTEAVLACRGGRALVPTGVAVAIPPGYAGFVLPRSGLALRHGITCLNAPGLIDSGYRGELQVILVNTDPEEDYKVARGDRIAQLVVMRVEAGRVRPGGQRRVG